LADNTRLMQGNEACSYGAIAAGCTFFAGYPITPSTEIAEALSDLLPRHKGVFIQMEDEIASISAILGASIAGAKTMTATSGPGFSLMQEALGFGIMTETPAVIVNVQRGGPSTGLPTKVSQGDTMQARWGTHGDHQIIALAPESVKECYDFTIKAFNLAEKYQTPVILLLDEVLGHMREKINVPKSEDLEIIDRRSPMVPPEWYEPFEITNDFISPKIGFGRGYRFHVTGLTHNEMGFPTNEIRKITDKMDKLEHKITRAVEDICAVEYFHAEDAKYLMIAYGTAARATKEAVLELRANRRMKVGMIRLQTIWPFPDHLLREHIRHAEHTYVVELNQGQMIYEVQRLGNSDKITGINRYDGEMITPAYIMNQVRGSR
jgi:2-oxoglutarate ferredoxin oxidoreductase subunit alpha